MARIGDTIKIIDMSCEPDYCGRAGIVTHIDDMGQLHGTWGGLAVIPGVDVYVVEKTLERFVEAQRSTYEQALKEIKAGRKLTHWMWWIFPQYKGLGVSETSMYYAIQSKAEAKAYWEHPLLGLRLRECMMALLSLDTNDAVKVFGAVDAQKLKSCMTLFYFNGENFLCTKVLDKFFHGEIDVVTRKLLQRE